MKISSIILFLVGLTLCAAHAQTTTYRSPVDFPISLSGNVGEIRSNHFHTGLDIRASQGVGSPIFSVHDGYVSRIFVSPYGYGHALYVTHTNGTMAVYGHLDGFNAKIKAWVTKQQYARKSFRVDLYPDKSLFPVKMGDQIAYMGNTGSSGGAHLHFELRDKNNSPINIGKQKMFKITDNIAPVIYQIYLFEQDSVSGLPIYKLASTLSTTVDKSGKRILTDSVFYTNKPAYIAYEMVDRKNGANFSLAVYWMSQKVNNTENFGFKIDNLSYSNTRYANAMAQYSLTTKTKYDVLRAFVAPNNTLTFYSNKASDGIIQPPIKTGERLKISTTIQDDNSNTASINFYIERKDKPSTKAVIRSNEQIVEWDYDFTHSNQNMSLSIPARSLYQNDIIRMDYDGKYYNIGYPEIPLQQPVTLSVNEPVEPSLRSKALFVNARSASVGGEWKNNRMELSTRSFGSFAISYDTVAPVILPLQITGNSLRFKITDNLSGVAKYELTVDGAWALAQYEPKQNLLFYDFERNNTRSQSHNIILRVTDAKGNEKIYKNIVKW